MRCFSYNDLVVHLDMSEAFKIVFGSKLASITPRSRGFVFKVQIYAYCYIRAGQIFLRRRFCPACRASISDKGFSSRLVLPASKFFHDFSFIIVFCQKIPFFGSKKGYLRHFFRSEKVLYFTFFDPNRMLTSLLSGIYVNCAKHMEC